MLNESRVESPLIQSVWEEETPPLAKRERAVLRKAPPSRKMVDYLGVQIPTGGFSMSG